jgi:hypothetical protein
LPNNDIALPEPSKFDWGLQDISAAESGRDDSTTMWKNRVGQKRKISIAWNGLKWNEVSRVLTAVNSEYFSMTYPDMMAGQYETRTFYVGDRSAPVKMWNVGNKRIETLSFDLIER